MSKRGRPRSTHLRRARALLELSETFSAHGDLASREPLGTSDERIRQIDRNLSPTAEDSALMTVPNVRSGVATRTEGMGHEQIIWEFRQLIVTDPNVSAEVRRMYSMIFDPPSTSPKSTSFNWSRGGDWMPCESEFAFGWMRLFLSKQWSKQEWYLIRKFMIWVDDRVCANSISRSEIKGWKGMNEITECLPGVGLVVIKEKNLWSEHHFAPLSRAVRFAERQLVALSQSDRSDSDSGQRLRRVTRGNRRVVEQQQCSFSVHPLDVQIALSLLLPNAVLSVDDSGTERNDTDVWKIECTLGHRMRQIFNDDFLCVRMDLTGPVIITRGSVLRKKRQKCAMIILSLQWKYVSGYHSFLKSGARQKEWKEKWSNPADRRPYVEIAFAGLRELKGGVWALNKDALRINYGAVRGRNVRTYPRMVDATWWAEWVLDEKIIIEEKTISHLTASPEEIPRPTVDLAEAPVWNSLKQVLHESDLKRSKSEAHDCDVTVHLSVGWDSFQSSSFGKRHRKATGVYAHVINNRGRLPTMTYAVLGQDTPIHACLDAFWEHLSSLETPRVGLGVRENEQGKQSLYIFKWRAIVSAVCLDKEMLDPFQLAVQSNRLNRCDGCLHRGFDDGLDPVDLFSLDGRFLKNWSFTRGRRSYYLNLQSTESAYVRVSKAEGWTRKAYAHMWHMPGNKVNPLIYGIPDIMHTFDGILQKLFSWILKGRESEDELFWMKMDSYLKCVYSLNHRQAVYDPFGRKKSERNNMKLSVSHAFNLWICLHAIRPGDWRNWCLRSALELLSLMYCCEDHSDVKRIQERTKDFMNGVSEVSRVFEEDFNFPKMRVLLILAYVIIPLHGNTLFWESQRIEHDHRYWKSVFRHHWNWKDDNNAHLSRYIERVRGLEFLDRGMRFGGRLQYGTSEISQNMCDPENHELPLFETRSVCGWGEGKKECLIMDITSEMRTSDDIAADDRRQLMEFLQGHGFKWERLQFGKRAQLCSWLTNISWDTQKGCWLLGRDACQRWFAIDSRHVVRAVRKVENDDVSEKYMIAVFGSVYLVTTDALDQSIERNRRDRSAKQNVGWYMDCRRRKRGFIDSDGRKDERRSGGDFLGMMWVPGCTIARPAFVVHTHTGDFRKEDGKGCGFHWKWTSDESTSEEKIPPGLEDFRTREWICDMNEGHYLEILDSAFLYQPRIMENESQTNSVPNKFYNFDLSHVL